MRVFLLDARIFRSFDAVAEQALISIRDYEVAARARLEPAALPLAGAPKAAELDKSFLARAPR